MDQIVQATPELLVGDIEEVPGLWSEESVFVLSLDEADSHPQMAQITTDAFMGSTHLLNLSNLRMVPNAGLSGRTDLRSFADSPLNTSTGRELKAAHPQAVHRPKTPRTPARYSCWVWPLNRAVNPEESYRKLVLG